MTRVPQGIVGLEYLVRDEKGQRTRSMEPADELLRQALEQIESYIKDPVYPFDLPLVLRGTSFQQRVWQALREIPAGQVKTYGQLAAELSSSAQAVGNACRNNPIPLIIPCHRVVSASGIGGFSGQTEGEKISLKRHLLAHEGVEIC